ncbi:MAG: isochorismatase, partial [Actinomycetota bacterium]
MRDGPFGARLGWGARPTLIVVDLVRAYTEPDGPLHIGARSTAVVRAVADLVDVARTTDVPVIWTTVRYRPDGL